MSIKNELRKALKEKELELEGHKEDYLNGDCDMTAARECMVSIDTIKNELVQFESR